MSDPTFNIPKEIIQPIIDAHVNQAVIAALDGRDQVVTRAIMGVLQTKVDSEGKPSSYGSSKPWIDWVIGKSIQESATRAVQEVLVTHKDRIKDELVRQLSQKKSPIFKQLIEGMLGALTREDTVKYRINVSFDNN